MSRHSLCAWAPLGATLFLLRAAAPPPTTLQGEVLAKANEAFQMEERGDSAGALAAFDAALRQAPGNRELIIAKTDLLLEGQHYPEAAATLAPLQGEATWAVQSRLGEALLGTGKAREAGAAYRIALAGAAGPDQRRSALTGLLDAARQLEDGPAELEALRGLRALDPGDVEVAKDEAYALEAAGRDREALEAFRSALGPGALPGDYLDAAYSARKAGRDAEARDYFVKAIQAQTPAYQLDTATLFGVRREVESLSRTWGGSLTTSYNQGGLVPGAGGNQKVLQQGAEVYYQPRRLTRGGRNVQLFARAYENIHAPDGWANGAPSLQPSVGVRGKPFEDLDLVLGVERVFKSASGTPADWLYTGAFSIDTGSDLQGGRSSWPYASVYTEAARFQKSVHYVQTLESRLGRSWRLGGTNAVFTPHAVLAGEYDNQQDPKPAWAAGPGLALRSWFRQSVVMAPASWVEFSVQYRWKLSSAERAQGWFGQLSFWF